MEKVDWREVRKGLLESTADDQGSVCQCIKCAQLREAADAIKAAFCDGLHSVESYSSTAASATEVRMWARDRREAIKMGKYEP